MQLKLKSIHPFAARMAPEIAFHALSDIKKGACILDPMVGSGTVLRTISEQGYSGIGIDIDPLSVLMSKAWTSTINNDKFIVKAEEVIIQSKGLYIKDISLPWIENDALTKEFIKYWFAQKQAGDLKRLSFILYNMKGTYADLLRIALSRIIITKQSGASLAADISHSRPHKVKDENDFDVFTNFYKSCQQLSKFFSDNITLSPVKVINGDARRMRHIDDRSVKGIITSPPYLNALDYIRGHKMSLIWLGYPIGELGKIRSDSVGSERALTDTVKVDIAKQLTKKLKNIHLLPSRKINIVYRYASDMSSVLQECARVLEKRSKATFVVGNSFINGVYIENSVIIAECAKQAGLTLKTSKVREIPANKRYLPPPKTGNNTTLNNRMKKEVILTFAKM